MATGIGETLSTTRRQQGRSLSEAAASTRVRETYLAAIEQEEFSALGGGVYVKGFIKGYAKFLGLDPEPLLERYRSEYEPRDEIGGPVEEEEPTGWPRALVVVVALAVVVIVVLALIGLFGSDDPAAAAALAAAIGGGRGARRTEGPG